MNKNEILENLAQIAAALDDQNMTREADSVTKVMSRVAQAAPNPFAPTDLRTQLFGQPAAPGATGQQAQIQNSLQSIFAPNAANPAAKPAAKPAAEGNDLVKRYLGWAFHAISVKKIAVTEVRAALKHHLLANKQTPAFTQQVLQAFDTQIANQKALQGK